MPDATSADQLRTQIVAVWLPRWQAHHDVRGPLRLSAEIDEEIARSVLTAIKREVVGSTGRGSFTLRGGMTKAAIFWHGLRSTRPQGVIFAYEGLISVAAANDLRDMGWRPYQMAFEVLASAFDLGVFDPRSNRMLIVCEAKTKAADVDKLVTQIERCGSRGNHEKASCPGSKVGHSKYAGLVEGRPELVWVVSPSYRRLFCPVYLAPGYVRLVETEDEQMLQKPGSRRRQTRA